MTTKTKKTLEVSEKMKANYMVKSSKEYDRGLAKIEKIDFSQYSDFEYELARQIFESWRKSSFDINKYISKAE